MMHKMKVNGNATRKDVQWLAVSTVYYEGYKEISYVCHIPLARKVINVYDCGKAEVFFYLADRYVKSEEELVRQSLNMN